MLPDDGIILDMNNCLLEGCNVTNCQFVRDDVVLVAVVNGESLSKLMTVDVETKETLLVLEMDKTVKALDIIRIPGTGVPYFIVQLCHSLILVDITKN